jgi:Membrane proteins related to metalloendopeptidases
MRKAFLFILVTISTVFFSETVQARSRAHRAHKSVARTYMVRGTKPTFNANDLLADQVKINKEKLRLDSIASIRNSGIVNSENEEDLYPALGLYENNWGNGVNPFKNKSIPDSLVMDLSNWSMPVMGDVTSNYGYRKSMHRFHYGIDLKLSVGDPVRVAFSGKVRVAGWMGGYGNVIVVRHSNGMETVYGHLSKHLVTVGQYVKAGEVIALGGNTGRSTGPHLHFETRFFGVAVNPIEIFDFKNKVTHMDTYVFYASNAKRKSGKELANVSGIAYHKVKSGDTLSSISEKYGTTIAVLKKLNKLRKNKLSLGQLIRTA